MVRLLFGANAGYAWASDPTMNCGTSIAPGLASPCVGNTFTAPKPEGGQYGLQAGYNWQTSNWVFGFETDINKLGVHGSAKQFPGIDPGKGADLASSRYDWLGTARGRVGVTKGPALFYATGGLAYGQVYHEYLPGLRDANQPRLQNDGKPGWMDRRRRRGICS